jgi:hypothetical protein
MQQPATDAEELDFRFSEVVLIAYFEPEVLGVVDAASE